MCLVKIQNLRVKLRLFEIFWTLFRPPALQCFSSLHIVNTNIKTLQAHCIEWCKHQKSLRLWLLHQKLVKFIVPLYTLTHSGKISHVSFHHFWNHFKNFTLFWPSLGGCSMLKKDNHFHYRSKFSTISRLFPSHLYVQLLLHKVMKCILK